MELRGHEQVKSAEQVELKFEQAAGSKTLKFSGGTGIAESGSRGPYRRAFIFIILNAG